MFKVVGFLSRAHGFNVLKALVDSKDFQLLRVYTHSLNPKSQDPTRSERSDFKDFVDICKKNNISLISIDSKDQVIHDVPECDFIIEVSWRFLIPNEVLQRARIGSFGIHRGKLPEYAGAEPIKQALLKNENEIVISAHELASKIDSGKTIAIEKHDVNYNNNETLEQNIQRLRDEITPIFSRLAFRTLSILNNN